MMLVLSRKEEESIVLDGTIVIKVLRLKNGRVRLGIEAPQEVKVLRGELTPQDSPPPPAEPAAN